MSPMNVPDSLTSEDTPAGLVTAGVYTTYAEAFAHSVVVLAMGESCWVVPSNGDHALMVEPHAFTRARDQLERYDRESIDWPPAPIAEPGGALRSPELITPFLWSVATLALFQLQGEHPEWVRGGELDPSRMFEQNEWWRAATALFLHGDAAHAISNALSGILVFSAAVSTLGRARGWTLIAIASLLGNLAIAVANLGRDYRSLGASTAIFAALGLLTGRAVRVVINNRHPHRWRKVFVPAAAGLIVLALYGAGGANVDVPAHAAGFIMGTLIGFVAGIARRESS